MNYTSKTEIKKKQLVPVFESEDTYSLADVLFHEQLSELCVLSKNLKISSNIKDAEQICLKFEAIEPIAIGTSKVKLFLYEWINCLETYEKIANNHKNYDYSKFYEVQAFAASKIFALGTDEFFSNDTSTAELTLHDIYNFYDFALEAMEHIDFNELISTGKFNLDQDRYLSIFQFYYNLSRFVDKAEYLTWQTSGHEEYEIFIEQLGTALANGLILKNPSAIIPGVEFMISQADINITHMKNAGLDKCSTYKDVALNSTVMKYFSRLIKDYDILMNLLQFCDFDITPILSRKLNRVFYSSVFDIKKC